MSQKKKTKEIEKSPSRHDRPRGRSKRKYDRSDTIIGFLTILLPVLAFAAYYFFFRNRDGESLTPTPASVTREAEIPKPAGTPTKNFDPAADPFGGIPDGPPPVFTGEELAACRDSAEAGDAEACYRLGRYFYDGPDKHFEEAAKYFLRAAEQGHAKAQYRTGLCYDLQKGVLEDRAEAANWYQMAADQGLVQAEYRLAECYDYGYGVPKDSATADRWFLAAAEQGYVKAQYKMGMRTTANIRSPETLGEAFTWFRKAAERGYPDAQFCLGRCYSSGEGVKADPAKAAEWYRLAAEQEHTASQIALAECYLRGDGVPRDPDEALRWYRRAAKNGDPNAKRILRRHQEQRD
ncbi:MAG: SEL1-like repeat protein [Thermoguttaceae bacterium]|nr:SEL1-like repeat protein [Thermoguttaceae bacterium]